MKILISACLLGERVRFDGRAKPHEAAVIDAWRDAGVLVPVCPEVAGLLPTPRPASEVEGGSGDAVLDGAARVMNIEGADVTENFLRGARHALALAQEHGAQVAIFKARSPSCGVHMGYDGSFQRQLVEGAGVAAALLRRHGVVVFSEEELDAASAWIVAHEGS